MASSPNLVAQIYENVGVSPSSPNLVAQVYENTGVGPSSPNLVAQVYENVTPAVGGSATLLAFRH